MMINKIYIPGQKARWNIEQLNASGLFHNLTSEYGLGPFTIINLGDEDKEPDFNQRLIKVETPDERKFSVKGKFLVPA